MIFSNFYNPDDSYFFLTGDFNSRIKDLNEILQIDQDLLNFCSITNTINTNERSIMVENLGLSLYRQSQDSSKTNTFGSRLIELCKNNNLVILNGRAGEDKGIGKYTTTGHSVVDYMIMSFNILRYLNNFRVHEFDPLLSDIHCPISCCTATDNFAETKSQEIGKDKSVFDSYVAQDTPTAKWIKEKASDFIKNISQEKVNTLCAYSVSLDYTNINATTINQIIPVEKMDEIVVEASKASFKSLTKTKHRNRKEKNPVERNQWFNKKCADSRRNYRKVKQYYQRLKSDNNKKNLTQATKEYKRTVKFHKKQYNKCFCKRLRDFKTTDPRTFWKLLKGRSPNNEEYESESVVQPQIVNVVDEQHILNRIITENEIQSCINRLKNHKAPGPDNILNEYIKISADILMQIYLKTFNLIFSTGLFPDTWSQGLIIPIHKKGDKMNPDNYRGITLLSCFGKLFTSIINDRMTKFVEDENILSHAQAGFRKGYSTTEQIFNLKCLIDSVLNSRKKTILCIY